jgi:pimeloyl-ACP methyl ester carboxylesterase
MRRIKKLWWVPPALLILVGAVFVLWASVAAQPMPEALAAQEPDSQVQIETTSWLVFGPVEGDSTTGLIFYPGGRVDARAYAPTARALAEEGYLVVIVPMPLNLAFLAPGRAAQVISTFTKVERWAVGGHSLGGAMAANFARKNPEAIHGLVLWAAYPADNDDLSDTHLAVVSIYGTRDGLATPDEIDASRQLLPPDTEWIAIEGGNHAQFGWYGSQAGDGEATISREEQQVQVLAATRQLLQRLGR